MSFLGDIAGAIIGGAASLFGGSSANNQTAKSAASAQALNAEQFRLQHLWDEANLGRAEMRDDARYQDAKASTAIYYNDAKQYETEMSNSAHQREVADMRLAGLNPILSAGGGASSPNLNAPTISATSGPMGQTHGAQSGVSSKYNDVLGPAMSSALGAYRSLKEMKNVEKEGLILDEKQKEVRASTQLSKQKYDTELATQDNIRADTGYKAMLGQQAQASSIQSLATAKESSIRSEAARAFLPALLNQADIEKSDFGKTMQGIDRVMESIGKILGGGNSAKQLLK